MDCVFSLEEEARAALLRVICRVLGCAYICLWSYLSPSSNFLVCKDGWYHEEESDQTGSSPSASLVRHLFNAYRGTVCNTRTGFVPGYVSREALPCLELRDSELFSLAAVEIQRQFYQEARIKVAAFLGCGSGEIELGMSTPKNINLEMEVTNLLTQIIQQSQLPVGDHQLPPLAGDQNRPSSSSSSLMSLSMGSPENSSLVFSIPTTTSYHDQLPSSTILNMQQLPQYPNQVVQYPILRAYNARNRHVVQFPSSASDDAAMTRAMLAVISSSSTSSSSRTPRRTGAFRPYNNMAPALRVNMQAQVGKSNSLQRDNNLLKRAFAFLKQMPRRGIFDHDQAPRLHETRANPNQLQHMITERRRREKLNEYFDALRCLLPPGIKKHKASVLSGTIETLESLKAEVSELKKKNTALQARLDQPDSKQAATEEEGVTIGNDERVRVEIVEASEASSSSEREMELQVTAREDVCSSLLDLAIRLLERLKQMNNIVGVISVEARTQLRGSNSFHRVTIRLRIQANDWEEQTFKEAMTRSVADDEVAAP